MSRKLPIVPAMSECTFELNFYLICWPPGADDCFTVHGLDVPKKYSKAQSYLNMLDNLEFYYDDRREHLTDAEEQAYQNLLAQRRRDGAEAMAAEDRRCPRCA